MTLENPPKIKEKDLRLLHPDLLQWAVFCADFDHELAKDILQLAYLKVLDGRAVFNQQSALKTWLFSVIRLTAMESMRKKPVVLEHWDNEALDNICDVENVNINEFSHETYTRQSIATALRDLSFSQREIIYLAFYKDLSLAEIAQITNVSIGSIRTLYHRAKVRLKVLLTEAESSTETKGVCYEKQYS